MKIRPFGAELFHGDRQADIKKSLLTVSGKRPRTLTLASIVCLIIQTD
jgi:hypothetical protein